ncbi:MAG TPA: IS110 family transposase [Anaerolineaceae bacterium]|nr:IS110 family transposase [Anaerolineaceae bacterium]
MSSDKSQPKRFIGLDLHKYYLVATGVDQDLNKVYGPRRVELIDLEEWIQKTITHEDALVVEATANAFMVYDTLVSHAHSMIVVHPAHLASIVKVPVKTDKKAAYELARLLAKGMLDGIWIPPQDVRDLRVLVSQRRKMINLKTRAKNWLQDILYRYSIPLPEGPLFDTAQRPWWDKLPLSKLEHVRITSNLAALDFAQEQIDLIETHMAAWAAQDERVSRLFELSGIGLVTSVTLLSAIGDITRFSDAEHLVGYAGMGVRVHDSGMTTRTGRITKAGRREMRAVLVEAAQVAVLHDPRWKAELDRLEPRLGRNKAIVAIARKMLVVVWFILHEHAVDNQLNLERLARKYYEFAYSVGKSNWGESGSAVEFIRRQLDQAGVGQEFTSFVYSGKNVQLPPSKQTIAEKRK